MKNESEKKDPDQDEGAGGMLTLKDVVDILEVIDSTEGRELNLETGDLKLSVIRR